MTVGDFVVERLLSWGVTRIYGYPGDGINGVMGALNRAKNKIQFIQARHEEMAALWPVVTQNLPMKSESAWPHPGQELSIY